MVKEKISFFGKNYTFKRITSGLTETNVNFRKKKLLQKWCLTSAELWAMSSL